LSLIYAVLVRVAAGSAPLTLLIVLLVFLLTGRLLVLRHGLPPLTRGLLRIAGQRSAQASVAGAILPLG
jgi:hypothetical protein